jgi:hypothetical protein
MRGIKGKGIFLFKISAYFAVRGKGEFGTYEIRILDLVVQFLI